MAEAETRLQIRACPLEFLLCVEFEAVAVARRQDPREVNETA